LAEVGGSGARVDEQKARDYLARRLAPQLVWYEAKARWAKRWHFGLMGAQLIATTAIPVVNVLTHSIIVSSVLAGVAALAGGFAQMARHQEHWLVFRQTAGALEALRTRHEIGLPPFDGDDRHDLMIAEAEKILAGEGTQWNALVSQNVQGSMGHMTIIGS
jgi:hypothetical protein